MSTAVYTLTPPCTVVKRSEAAGKGQAWKQYTCNRAHEQNYNIPTQYHFVRGRAQLIREQLDPPAELLIVVVHCFPSIMRAVDQCALLHWQQGHGNQSIRPVLNRWKSYQARGMFLSLACLCTLQAAPIINKRHQGEVNGINIPELHCSLAIHQALRQ